MKLPSRKALEQFLRLRRVWLLYLPAAYLLLGALLGMGVVIFAFPIFWYTGLSGLGVDLSGGGQAFIFSVVFGWLIYALFIAYIKKLPRAIVYLGACTFLLFVIGNLNMYLQLIHG